MSRGCELNQLQWCLEPFIATHSQPISELPHHTTNFRLVTTNLPALISYNISPQGIFQSSLATMPGISSGMKHRVLAGGESSLVWDKDTQSKGKFSIQIWGCDQAADTTSFDSMQTNISPCSSPGENCNISLKPNTTKQTEMLDTDEVWNIIARRSIIDQESEDSGDEEDSDDERDEKVSVGQEESDTVAATPDKREPVLHSPKRKRPSRWKAKSVVDVAIAKGILKPAQLNHHRARKRQKIQGTNLSPCNIIPSSLDVSNPQPTAHDASGSSQFLRPRDIGNNAPENKLQEVDLNLKHLGASNAEIDAYINDNDSNDGEEYETVIVNPNATKRTASAPPKNSKAQPFQTSSVNPEKNMSSRKRSAAMSSEVEPGEQIPEGRNGSEPSGRKTKKTKLQKGSKKKTNTQVTKQDDKIQDNEKSSSPVSKLSREVVVEPQHDLSTPQVLPVPGKIQPSQFFPSSHRQILPDEKDWYGRYASVLVFEVEPCPEAWRDAVLDVNNFNFVHVKQGQRKALAYQDSLNKKKKYHRNSGYVIQPDSVLRRQSAIQKAYNFRTKAPFAKLDSSIRNSSRVYILKEGYLSGPQGEAIVWAESIKLIKRLLEQKLVGDSLFIIELGVQDTYLLAHTDEKVQYMLQLKSLIEEFPHHVNVNMTDTSIVTKDPSSHYMPWQDFEKNIHQEIQSNIRQTMETRGLYRDQEHEVWCGRMSVTPEQFKAEVLDKKKKNWETGVSESMETIESEMRAKFIHEETTGRYKEYCQRIDSRFDTVKICIEFFQHCCSGAIISEDIKPKKSFARKGSNSGKRDQKTIDLEEQASLISQIMPWISKDLVLKNGIQVVRNATKSVHEGSKREHEDDTGNIEEISPKKARVTK
ncbi:hypothetical protein BS50DRAFT_589917 [Corynespora cassiicola Philippines]|uniref:Uncharacterized protein n=1 Tax=Corynespora cassiicola Philippines TaxID=1448308 RepID=A0A2T2NJI5_CORCC|nr:hypothetical protein BS50DRAFT_589917 [Corynespora cassiicola Philippines]